MTDSWLGVPSGKMPSGVADTFVPDIGKPVASSTTRTCKAAQPPKMDSVSMIVRRRITIHLQSWSRQITEVLELEQCEFCGTPSRIPSGFTGHERTSNHFTPARMSAPCATLCYPRLVTIWGQTHLASIALPNGSPMCSLSQSICTVDRPSRNCR